MAEGFVKLHRAVLDTPWADKPNVLSVYIHLLLRAAHQDTKVGEVELLAGQAVISIRSLAKDTGLSMQQVRTALKNLELTHKITQVSTQYHTLVTVENWAFEQGAKQKVTHPSTQQSTLNKKDNFNKLKLSISDLQIFVDRLNKLGLTQVKKLSADREKHLRKRLE